MIAALALPGFRWQRRRHLPRRRRPFPQQSVTTPAQTQPCRRLAGAQMPPAARHRLRYSCPPPAPAQRLTVQDAEALALKNNPQISVYHLLSLASSQVTREQRRVLSQRLRQPDRRWNPGGQPHRGRESEQSRSFTSAPPAASTLSQLITDFGRTNNLVATAALRAKAADMNAVGHRRPDQAGRR